MTSSKLVVINTGIQSGAHNRNYNIFPNKGVSTFECIKILTGRPLDPGTSRPRVCK